MNRGVQGGCIVIGSLTVSALALASAVAWGPQRDKCQLLLPSIIGCAIGSYENLSGGLFAASAAVFAGWMAWTAVQLQISADERRAVADRIEVEGLLAEDVDQTAEGLAAVWKVLENIDRMVTNDPDLREHVEVKRQVDAAIWGVEEICYEAWLVTGRKMTSVLGWKSRRLYEQHFTSLERLRKIVSSENFDIDAGIDAVRDASSKVQMIEPKTKVYFEDFFQRSGKAWSLGYAILVQAGLEDAENN